MILTKSKIYEKNLFREYESLYMWLGSCIYPKIKKYFIRKKCATKNTIDNVLLKHYIQQRDVRSIFKIRTYEELILKLAVYDSWLSLIQFLFNKYCLINFCLHYMHYDCPSEARLKNIKRIFNHYTKGKNREIILENYSEEDGYIEGFDYWVKETGKICWKY